MVRAERHLPGLRCVAIGVADTIESIIGDLIGELVGARAGPEVALAGRHGLGSPRLSDRGGRDRPARPVWNQMKQNAVAASDGDGGMVSAGGAAWPGSPRTTRASRSTWSGTRPAAIMLGAFLDPARPAIGSRPAPCPSTRRRARWLSRTALPAGRREQGHRSPARRVRRPFGLERAGRHGGPYGKSLLYLVSRALEPVHKTPILGMEATWNPGSTRKASSGADARTSRTRTSPSGARPGSSSRTSAPGARGAARGRGAPGLQHPVRPRLLRQLDRGHRADARADSRPVGGPRRSRCGSGPSGASRPRAGPSGAAAPRSRRAAAPSGRRPARGGGWRRVSSPRGGVAAAPACGFRFPRRATRHRSARGGPATPSWAAGAARSVVAWPPRRGGRGGPPARPPASAAATTGTPKAAFARSQNSRRSASPFRPPLIRR